MKLRAVVERQGSRPPHGAANKSDRPTVRLAHRALLEFADEHVPCLPIHEREHAVLVRAADHGVALEVTGARTVLGTRRPLGEHALAGQATAAVVAPIALAHLLDPLPQVAVQRASIPAILPDVAVNRLMTDREPAFQCESSGDLLGTPELLQAGHDQSPVFWREASVAARSG